MARLAHTTIKVTTTGEAAAAVGDSDSEGVIVGEILGILVNYHASAPATTDLTIKTKGNGPASYNVLVAANTATDAYVAPRAKPVDNANAAITDAHAPFAVADKINVALAECDALTDAVIVTVFYLDHSK